jgi:acetolactate synthase I/II/III large subunit
MGEDLDRRAFLKVTAGSAAGAVLPASAAAAPTTPAVGAQQQEAPSRAAAVPEYATVVEASDGAELMLHAIAANGVEKIFMNGGTDNYHFMEMVAKFRALGRPTPDLVTVTYEATALYLQMGYFQWKRRPQLTVLHVALGTINAGGAWDEALRANAGLVVMAGIPGQTTKGELGYSQRGGIQYLQEVHNQADVVRPYIKWDYEIKRVENAALIINSGYRIAASEPCGAAYITYPLEVAEAPLNGGFVYRAADFAPATSAQGDSGALREAARLLVQAKNPLVLVGHMGRHPEAVASLVALAERLALPVSSMDKFVNLPKSHWSRSPARLAERDVILVIDHPTPWMTDPSKTAKIIRLDIDPMLQRFPFQGHPTHIPITCNSALALPLLTQMCTEFITPERKTAFAARRAALVAAKAAADETAAAATRRAKAEFPLSTVWINECINQVADEDTVITWDIGGVGQQYDRTPPGHLFQQCGASLGSAWPRAIGIKMAAPGKTVISAGGDGCTIFSDPISCLMVSRMYSVPTLHIVSNNNAYRAVESGLVRYGGADSYAAKSGYNGSALKPSPDFAGIAHAVGAYGEKVTDPAVMPSALRRGLEAVKGGQAAVLDCITVRE